MFRKVGSALGHLSAAASPGGGSKAVKSIQAVTVPMYSGASVGIAINKVDPEQTILICPNGFTADAINNASSTYSISDPTTITAKRTASSAAATQSATIYVVEFERAIRRIIRGEAFMVGGAATASVSIAGLDASKLLVNVTGTSYQNSTGNPSNYTVYSADVSGSNVVFRRTANAGQFRCGYEIVEFY